MNINIFYNGQVFPLRNEQGPDLKKILESDDDSVLDTAIAGISGAMIRHFADKVSSSTQGTTAELRLQFSH